MAGYGSTMHLGYVGRPLPGDEQLDISLSRVGGKPVWCREPPAANPVHSEGYFTCQVCQGPLVMLGQFAAGYASAPRRALHLFVCAGASCGADPRAWRALRTVEDLPETSPATPAAQASAPSSAATTSGAQHTVAGDDWGVAGGDWAAGGGDDWGAGGGDDWGAAGGDDWGTAGAAQSGMSVDAEIEQLLQTRDSRPTASRAKPASKPADAAQNSEAAEAAADDSWLGTRGASPAEAWPCFALEIYAEPPAEPKSGAHEEELLQRYLQSELANEDLCNAEAGVSVPPEFAEELSAERARLKAEAGTDEPEDDDLDMDVEDDDCSGDGREMEWLLKFQRRLRRSPEQVVRYSWGGSPLWMAPPPREASTSSWPPSCTRCGAPRSFELQVLPTLPFRLGAASGDGSVMQEVSWGTACVYTCSKDCLTDGPCEEFLVVQAAA